MIYRNDQDNGRWGASPDDYDPQTVDRIKGIYRDNKVLVIAIAIVTALLGAAALWGVSSSNEDGHSSDSGYALNEEQYLDKVMTLVGFDSESFALHYGYDICEQLDILPAHTVVAALGNDGYNIPDANKGAAVKAATTNLCAEHGAEVRRLIRQYGN